MSLSELSAFLFPYRTHLERELVYAKEQLAQAHRRADILQAELMARKVPQIVNRIPAYPATKPVAKGWDATRAEERSSREPREKLPQGTDAGSENKADGAGFEANTPVLS